MDKRGFRISEAVQYSAQPRTRVYQAIQSQALKSYKIGKSRLILREDLDRWIDDLTRDASVRAPDAVKDPEALTEAS